MGASETTNGRRHRRWLLSATAALLTLLTACATDDPLPSTNSTFQSYEPTPDRSEVQIATTVPPSSTTASPTTGSGAPDEPKVEQDPVPPTTTIPPALTATYKWGERSDTVRWLQRTLRVEADGVYGPITQMAHAAALETAGLQTYDVPTRPAAVRSAPSRTFADAPAPILAAIHNLWPEHEWARAQSVAWCESNYRLDAANPTSSARGVFQLLAPWTRDPGSGRQVWGWHYADNGEKLSAAAGLGIAENDARYGLGNISVAYEIWRRSGWGPWAASQTCWAE